MAAVTHVLFESASGYAVFDVLEASGVANLEQHAQESINDFGRFSRVVRLRTFAPFTSAEHALENISCVSEGAIHDFLRSVLTGNLEIKSGGGSSSKSSNKSAGVVLGVQDVKLATSLNEQLGVSCTSAAVVTELCRGIRLHLDTFVSQLKDGLLGQAQLGLAHSYSRAKVKFNVNRADNMILQSINLLDKIDKDINTFAMRCREWYSWHFPELVKIVNDNHLFARCMQFIKHKEQLTDDALPALEEIVQDAGVAQQIVQAARTSMGMELSPLDMTSIEHFAKRVVALGDYRKTLMNYLESRMDQVAPNLASLVGNMVGARLIAHAGSLTNLAKYPASTVQILGAEKALFRALKKRQNTPKYGLIYHSTFIGRAAAANKGRISRYLANKCSIASRIDCFAPEPSKVFGQFLNSQVEERLEFYETGKVPRKNVDVMHQASEAVVRQLGGADLIEAGASDKKHKSKDREESKGKKRHKEDAGAASSSSSSSAAAAASSSAAAAAAASSSSESKRSKADKAEKKEDKKDKKKDKSEKEDKKEKKKDKDEKKEKKEKKKDKK